MMVVEDPKHRVERFVRQIGATKNGPQNNQVSASDYKADKSEVNCSRESCNTNQGSKLSGYKVAYMTYSKIIDMNGPILLHWIYEYFDIDTKKLAYPRSTGLSKSSVKCGENQVYPILMKIYAQKIT